MKLTVNGAPRELDDAHARRATGAENQPRREFDPGDDERVVAHVSLLARP